MLKDVTPEKTLGLAIIKRAVEDALGYRISILEKGRWKKDAITWLFQAWDFGEYTFEWWCDQLDISATRIRSFVVSSKQKAKVSARKSDHLELLRWIYDDGQPVVLKFVK